MSSSNNNANNSRRKKQQLRYQQHVLTRGGTEMPLQRSLSEHSLLPPTNTAADSTTTDADIATTDADITTTRSKSAERPFSMKRRTMKNNQGIAKKMHLVKKLHSQKHQPQPQDQPQTSTTIIITELTTHTSTTTSNNIPTPTIGTTNTTMEITTTNATMEGTNTNTTMEGNDTTTMESSNNNTMEGKSNTSGNTPIEPPHQDTNHDNNHHDTTIPPPPPTTTTLPTELNSATIQQTKNNDKNNNITTDASTPGWDTRHVLLVPPMEEKKTEWDTTTQMKLLFPNQTMTKEDPPGITLLFDKKDEDEQSQEEQATLETLFHKDVVFNHVAVDPIQQEENDVEEEQVLFDQENTPQDALLNNDPDRSEMWQQIDTTVSEQGDAEVVLSQQERIEQYLATSYVSSDDEEEPAIRNNNDDDDNEQQDEDIPYVNHYDYSPTNEDMYQQQIEVVENLDLLTIATTLSLDHSLVDSSIVGTNFLPPGGSLADTASVRTFTQFPVDSQTSKPQHVVPLIKPPPEEKWNKWQEQKMRPYNHLQVQPQPMEVYAKMTVGNITERRASFDRDDAKAKWKESRRVEDVVQEPTTGDEHSIASAPQVAHVELVSVPIEPNVIQDGLIESTNDDMAEGSTSFFSCGAGTNFLNVSVFDSHLVDSKQTKNTEISRSSSHGKSSIPLEDNSHNSGVNLIGGAFSPWKNTALACPSSDSDIYGNAVEAAVAVIAANKKAIESSMSENDLIQWLQCEVFKPSAQEALVIPEEEPTLDSILREKGKLNILARFVTDKMNETLETGTNTFQPTGTMRISPPETSGASATVLAANFVSFLQRVSTLTGVMSPFKNDNPFLLDILGSLKDPSCPGDGSWTMQDKLFCHERGNPVEILRFLFVACESARHIVGKSTIKDQVKPRSRSVAFPDASGAMILPILPRRYHAPPLVSPGPFETTFWTMPTVVLIALGFLGDPVMVCRMKMVNQYCSRIITENEHTVMRDAVRLGGMSMNVRPAFWIWITLEKAGKMNNFSPMDPDPRAGMSLCELEQKGREGKWHHVIGRDVARAFGNMPPHKTGGRFRADSIVRALITWGQGRLMKRGVKGGGEETPTPALDGRRPRVRPRQSMAPPPWDVNDDTLKNRSRSETPTDTVSDWGGVSPVGSFASSIGEDHAQKIARQSSNTGERSNSPGQTRRSRAVEELALSGNALTNDMKQGLQNQLGFILHALAAAHQDVGYCQGMDYVVAHLLRVLQDTVRWRAVKGTLPSVILGAEHVPYADITDSSQIDDTAIDKSLVVEEAVFRVMDCLFTSYNLRHMYWPELRCLKTCCLVFERLIHLKLPVLADHFEHHELNVGLFALGWFQTLFLYLPSMPSATVCHMWDIWLVERSFKIFFRVGTAILFLSQPILLNHEMEGMMTYLNTFPDATLLNPDILIACALQIKVTNKMLTEIEMKVTGGI